MEIEIRDSHQEYLKTQKEKRKSFKEEFEKLKFNQMV